MPKEWLIEIKATERRRELPRGRVWISEIREEKGLPQVFHRRKAEGVRRLKGEWTPGYLDFLGFRALPTCSTVIYHFFHL